MSCEAADAAHRLSALLDRENAALAASDLHAAAAMLAAKQDAVAAFTRALSCAPSSSPALHEAGARLATAAAENRRLLERGIEVQGRVLEMLLRALPRPAPTARYAPAGAAHSPAAFCAPMALSVRA